MKNAAEACLDPAKDVQNTAKAPRNKQVTGGCSDIRKVKIKQKIFSEGDSSSKIDILPINYPPLSRWRQW